MKRINFILSAAVLCFSVLLCGCRENGKYDVYVNIASTSTSQEISVDRNLEPVYAPTTSISSSTAPEISSTAASSLEETSPVSETSIEELTPNETSISSSSASSAAEPVIVVAVESSTESSSTSKEGEPQVIVVIPEQSTTGEASTATPESSVGDTSIGDTPGGNGETSDVSGGNTSSSVPVESTTSSAASAEPEIDPHQYEGEVYVASSGSGKRFHITPTCSNMKGAVAMTVEEAEAKGYTPCSKCW